MPDLGTRTRSGPGRLLIAVYAVFALAATARSAVQLATKFDAAPLAYLLSAFAAVVYIVATVCLARGDRTSRRVATVSIVVELVGVLVVGTLSIVDPQAFPGRDRLVGIRARLRLRAAGAARARPVVAAAYRAGSRSLGTSIMRSV